MTYTQHKDEPAGNQTKSADELGRRARRQMRRRRTHVGDGVGHGASHGGARQQVAPLLVHHRRHHLLLVVAAHHRAQQENNQQRHWVERHPAGRFLGFVLLLQMSDGRLARDALFQPISHSVRLEEQTALDQDSVRI